MRSKMDTHCRNFLSTKSCSSSCSCSKCGSINWTGFVCPLRSACFVGRRSLQKGAVRATSPRPAMGRASLLANQVSSRLTVAQQSSGAVPRDISSFCELLRLSLSFRLSKTE